MADSSTPLSLVLPDKIKLSELLFLGAKFNSHHGAVGDNVLEPQLKGQGTHQSSVGTNQVMAFRQFL